MRYVERVELSLDEWDEIQVKLKRLAWLEERWEETWKAGQEQLQYDLGGGRLADMLKFAEALDDLVENGGWPKD